MGNRGVIIIIGMVIYFISKIIGEYREYEICTSAILLLVSSLIGYELYIREKNLKNGGSKSEEKIIVRNDKDYYLGMALAMPMMGIVYGLLMIRFPEVIYSNDQTSITIVILVGILLLLSFGYFYIVSNIIVYRDGIMLVDNKFISKGDIEEIVYRRTMIKKRKLIKINTNKSAKVERNEVTIKCESEEEFIKVINALEELTGIQAKNLEW